MGVKAKKKQQNAALSALPIAVPTRDDRRENP
jgi:hypothetical protein